MNQNAGTLIFAADRGHSFIQFDAFKVETAPNFMNYIHGDWKLDLMTAFSFTQTKEMLHNPKEKKGSYLAAVGEVSKVLAPYIVMNNDQPFSMFGFNSQGSLVSTRPSTDKDADQAEQGSKAKIFASGVFKIDTQYLEGDGVAASIKSLYKQQLKEGRLGKNRPLLAPVLRTMRE